MRTAPHPLTPLQIARALYFVDNSIARKKFYNARQDRLKIIRRAKRRADRLKKPLNYTAREASILETITRELITQAAKIKELRKTAKSLF